LYAGLRKTPEKVEAFIGFGRRSKTHHSWWHDVTDKHVICWESVVKAMKASYNSDPVGISLTAYLRNFLTQKFMTSLSWTI